MTRLSLACYHPVVVQIQPASPILIRALRCFCLRCGHAWIAPRPAHQSALDGVALSISRRLDSGAWTGDADARGLAQILRASVEAVEADDLVHPYRCPRCRSEWWDVPRGSRRVGRPSLLEEPRLGQIAVSDARRKALRAEERQS